MKNKFPSEREMGNLMDGKNWAETPLGSKEDWPEDLHFAMRMCFSSNSPSGVCWDSDNYIFFYNDAWSHLLEDKDSLISVKPAREIFKNGWKSVKNCFEQVFSEGTAIESKRHVVSPNGEKDQLFNLLFNPIPNGDGSVAGVFCTAIPAAGQTNVENNQQQNRWGVSDFFKNNSVSEQKQEELTNALLSAIVKGSEDAIISKDLDSIITSWNESAERMFGYTAEEAIGRPITIIFPENRLDEEDEIISRIKRGERIDHVETKRKRKDGSLLDVSLTISPIKDSEGNIVGASKIARDITEKKRAEEKLRRSRNRLRTTLQIDTVGVIFWGGDNFTIQEVNDAFLEMSGYDRKEITGKNWRELTPEEFYPVSEKGVANLKERKHPEPYEKQYIRKDGTRWWGLCAPRRIDDKEVVEFVLDITERKKANEKLEALNETLEEQVEKRTRKLQAYQKQLRYLASQLNKAEERERQRLASELHDHLGQMLTVAKMKVDSLHSHQASTEVEELKEVIDDALKYNQNLMTELKPPPVLDKEDVTEVIYWTAKKMEKKGLDISVEDDGRPKPVNEEIRLVLHQSVRELLQNVKKHAGTDKVSMSLAREKRNIKITIKDKGKGFDVDGNSMTTAEDGKFGLFNIKERLDWHGGGFDVESESGKGTKAMVYAPLKEDARRDKTTLDRESQLPPEQKEKQNEAQKIRILLADDHEMVRRGLRQMIQKQDDLDIVGEASNGEEAVELTRKNFPHIIIMDVNMPVMDGIEATKKIKTEMPQMRIIGLSLHDSPEVIQDMRNAGASNYLTKSEAFESLIATIRAEVSASGNSTNRNNNAHRAKG